MKFRFFRPKKEKEIPFPECLPNKRNCLSIFFLLFVFLALHLITRMNECHYEASCLLSQPGFPQHGMKSDSPAACSPSSTPDNNPVKNNDKKKRSFIPKLFGKRGRKGSSDGELYIPEQDESTVDSVTSRRTAFMEESPVMRKSFSERQTNSRIEGLNLSRLELSMAPATETQEFRMFVATWNVAGRTPENTLNLEEFLQVETPSDIYVLGFQEIVPLNAGNVLVVEDSEPAAKWLILINQALNRLQLPEPDSNNGAKSPSSNNLFHKPSLKVLSRNYRADNSNLKACNCIVDETLPVDKQWAEKLNNLRTRLEVSSCPTRTDSSSYDFLRFTAAPISPTLPTAGEAMSYRLVTSKQMVGIFLAIWARNEVADHIGHLRVCSVGRGILGRLGNKGCISISMSLHETSFCFVCSHLASGEKDGDELKRNSDVLQIIKNTHFPKVCKKSYQLEPENIIDHDRVIWMGDLNYRISMTYEETKVLLDSRDWDTLLGRDQLNLEREAGRVFNGFKEGKIVFAPTYKYCQNSDTYSGETIKSKKKRRTPAWCDRILWRGNGIEQLSYMRWESQFSDHRPVSSMFTVNVEVRSVKAKFRKGYSCTADRLPYRDSVSLRASASVYDL